MRIEIVHHQHNAFGFGIVAIDQVPNDKRKVHFGAMVCDFDLTPALQRFRKHKQVGRAIPHIFVVFTGKLAGLWQSTGGDLTDQLFATFVKADLRTFGVVRPLVNFQHVFHGADKIGVLLGRQNPLFFQPRLKFIFFRVVRTHSGPMESTTLSSTNLFANNSSVQRRRPSGGAPQASATRRASLAPSSLRYCRSVGRLALRADSSPSSTNAWRTRCTVDCPTSNAAVICASDQFGPAVASAFNKIRAWTSLRAAALPFEINVIR